jgi:hypothetical protein
MAYKLICTVPMHGIRKGDAIIDQAAVERLSVSHPHHFVRTTLLDTDAPAPAVEPALEKPAK